MIALAADPRRAVAQECSIRSITRLGNIMLKKDKAALLKLRESMGEQLRQAQAHSQQAQDSSADAVVAGAAGAAAFLAHSTRAVLRDAARHDGAS